MSLGLAQRALLALLCAPAATLLPACLAPTVEGSVGDTGVGPVTLFADLGQIEGQVLDGAGDPIADARLTTWPGGVETVSDADGHYLLSRLAPGEVQVVAKAPGLEPSTSTPVSVEPGGTVDLDVLLDVTEPTGGTVQVSVTGPDLLPLEGATVSVSSGGTATTDADGIALIDQIDGDDLDLTVTAPDTWGRSLRGVSVHDGGGLQWAVTLSGKASTKSDYIGEAACLYCHDDKAATHEQTLHASAWADSATDTLLARFTAGERVALGAAQAVLSLQGGEPTVTLRDSGGQTLTLPVAGWIASPSVASVPVAELDAQLYPLPVGWVAADDSRSGYPDADAALVPYQTDRWFDEGGAFLSGDGQPDPATSAEANCLPCHTTGYALSSRSDGGVDMSATVGGGRFIDGSVGCEACHGPGEKHRDARESDKPWTITNPALLDPDRAIDVCAQCHSRTEALGSGLPYPFLGDGGTWQPGEDLADFTTSAADHWPSGAAALTRMQADELALSPHGDGAPYAGPCFDCHEAHGAGTDDRGAPASSSLRLAPEDNSLCLSCHLGMSFGDDDDTVVEHTGHVFYDPEGITETGRCVACHMPGTTAGLRYGDLSGAGDHSSHIFSFLPPQDSVDAFDDAGATSLDPGQFPASGCMDCHAWNTWLFSGTSIDFPGPWGDPTLRQTHVDLQAATEELWP